MSGFIAAAMPVNHIRASDARINRMDWRCDQVFADMWAIVPAPFLTEWWPRSGLMGDLGADVAILVGVRWGEYDQAAGAASRYGFVGVTRDALGSPIVSCVCKLFRTSDDTLIDSTTSDPTTGAFLLNTPHTDAHYIVAHKTGSPDVDGATPNTLLGT